MKNDGNGGGAFRHGTSTLVISDSDSEPNNVSDIDDEIASIYYENSKLFSQIENEYLKTIFDIDSPQTALQQPTQNNHIQAAGKTSISTENADTLVHLFSSSDEDGKETANLVVSDHTDWDSYELGGDSQDFIASLPLDFVACPDYASFERYWYSDEDLPPLENVVTLDILKTTPSLAYMYEFFTSKLST